MKFLGQLLHDPNIWHLNRRSVSGAFAVGLFTAYMPLPGQMLIAALLSMLFRVNLPLSVTLVWVTNPFTIPPMFYLAYGVGARLLGTQVQPLQFEFSLDWLLYEMGARWQPFLLGCLIMATLSALAGFIVIRVLWRLHLVQRLKERHLLRSLGIDRFKRK